MNKFLSLIILISTLASGCSSNQQPVPGQIEGVTGLATAYTLSTDANPAIGVSRIMHAKESDLDALASEQVSVIVHDAQLGSYRIESTHGGATIVSPRHLLLTDHQMLWRDAQNKGSVYLNDLTQPLQFVKVVGRQHTRPGGLTLIELLMPPDGLHCLAFVQSPEDYHGESCWLIIDRTTFFYNNKDFIANDIIRAIGNFVFIKGKVLSKGHRTRKFIDADFFSNGNVTIQVQSDVDLDGASGFPVLVYDKGKQEWAALATTVSSRLEVFENRPSIQYIHASRPSHDLMKTINE